MLALTFDRSREEWACSTGLVKEQIATPSLVEPDGADRSNVILKVKYAGFCGSDRGIWWRKAFGDMILGSLDSDGGDKRIGTWDRFRDGTVVMDYTQNNPGTEKQTWSFQVDSAITGTGTWSRGDDTCDLIFTEGNCKLRNCSDPDLESKCTVEVTWPDF